MRKSVRVCKNVPVAKVCAEEREEREEREKEGDSRSLTLRYVKLSRISVLIVIISQISYCFFQNWCVWPRGANDGLVPQHILELL